MSHKKIEEPFRGPTSEECPHNGSSDIYFFHIDSRSLYSFCRAKAHSLEVAPHNYLKIIFFATSIPWILYSFRGALKVHLREIHVYT